MSILESGKIVVTGGAGFIGSSLIWALNERGIDNILVIDRMGEDDKFKNLVPLRFDDFKDADRFLADLESRPGQFDDVSAVFHLGACTDTTERDSHYLIRNNYEYTRTMALWALDKGKRFIYASSAATYGDGSRGMSDADDWIGKLRPLNMYGYSKHLFDLFARRHGMLDNIVGLKYFNIFGTNEYQKGDMRSLVHKAFEQIRSSGRVGLFKSYHPDYRDGEQMRDFLYVNDAVAMMLHLAEKSGAAGIFNIGSGEANTWISLVSAIFTALEKPEEIDFIEMPESLRSKYQYFTRADISKLQKAGYEKQVTPLAEAVADCVKNYLVPGKRLGEEN